MSNGEWEVREGRGGPTCARLHQQKRARACQDGRHLVLQVAGGGRVPAAAAVHQALAGGCHHQVPVACGEVQGKVT